MKPPQVQKKSNKWPIIMMMWPAALLVLTLLIYVLVDFIFGLNGLQPSQENIPQVIIILNTVLYLIGPVVLIVGPISFIIGLILMIINLSKK